MRFKSLMIVDRIIAVFYNRECFLRWLYKSFMNFQILLYRHYSFVEDPKTEVEEHLMYCHFLGLRGRVYIAPEGISGTVSGLTKDVESYITYMQEHPLFSEIVFKVDEADAHAFHKIHVRVKPELLIFRSEKDVNPKALTGEYIAPVDFY